MPTGPRTILPNPRQFPRFAGVPTFCRFPLVEQVPAEHRPIDWVIYGIPFDLGVTYRPGARFGPRAIRDESQYVKPYHIEHGLDLSTIFSMADGGDAPIRAFNSKETLDAAAEFAMTLGDPQRTKVFAVGGDHSIAYANLKATWQRRNLRSGGRSSGGLPMLHFDAHVDTVDQTGGSKWSHASPFRRAIEEGMLDPKRMLSVGIRGPLNTGDDLAYAREQGITLVTYDEWRRGDGRARIREFLRALGDAETYVTVDIDCVDPAFAPGTGTPCCGGFTAAEALELIRGCRGVSIAGADVVEVLPDRDHAGITALLAAHVIFEIICLDAVRRLAKPGG
jgi:agmatinase